MNRLLIVLLFTIFVSTFVFSGEFSNFEVVGFSNDNKYFSFAEYGITERALPFANIFIVDVARNTFVPNGILQKTFNILPQIEEDGTGALFSVLLEKANILQQYQINPVNKGKLIYVLLDGKSAPSQLRFIDYTSNISYNVTLNQQVRLNGSDIEGASFDISLLVIYKGLSYRKTVGKHSYFRKRVKNYIIRSIYTNQSNVSLIFVVEKQQVSSKDPNDINIHFMAESVSWR